MSDDRWAVVPLIPEAVARLAVARVALWCLPYGRVIRLCGLLHSEPPAPGTHECPPLGPVRRAVSIASGRLVPWSTCLTRALAAHGMLRRRGYRSHLAVGLSKEDGRLQAHAWLRLGAHWVTGQAGHKRSRMVVWFH